MKPIKLYVHKIPPVADGLAGHVRITPTAETIVRELQMASGLSARQIVSEIIIQAAEFVEIEEVDA